MKSLRIIYCTVLAATLAGFALSPGQTQESATEDKPYFSDVPKEHWAYNAVQRLVRAGIIEGYPAGTEQRPNWTKIPLPQTAIVQPLIKSALAANATLKTAEINVDTTSDSIFLSGTVENEFQKRLVEAIAKQKAGNLKIVNNVLVVHKVRPTR
ncbi:MAG: BON domain-containing protein [Abitibacteriaceae bacterium]|nr:BON domain-containing protein [Abditibacteriaceae bacterium]MBV9865061.1 BON domain-containing protein [Abditibacteriaceae bacterium]